MPAMRTPIREARLLFEIFVHQMSEMSKRQDGDVVFSVQLSWRETISKLGFFIRMRQFTIHLSEMSRQFAGPQSERERYRIRQRGKGMNEWWFLILIAAWLLLQTVILPKLGVPT